MPNDQPLENLEALLYQLKQRDIPCQKIENEPHIRLVTRLEDQEGSLHVRWQAAEEIIQLVHIMPLTIPKKHMEKMLILLNRINLTLPVMGLAINEDNGMVMHRFSVFLDRDKTISFEMIYALIGLSIRLTKEIYPKLQKSMTAAAESGFSDLFDSLRDRSG